VAPRAFEKRRPNCAVTAENAEPAPRLQSGQGVFGAAVAGAFTAGCAFE
jgi:hypothetical protein